MNCLSVEEYISINIDGSGTAIIKYIVPKNFYSNPQMPPEMLQSIYPLTPEAIKKSVEEKKGVKLLSLDTEKDEKNVIITTKIEFENISNLSDRSTKYEIIDEGDEKLLKIKLNIKEKKEEPPKQEYTKKEGEEEPLITKEKIQEMVIKNLEKYQNKIIIKFPTKITECNAEKKSRRTAYWTIPTSIFYTGGEDIIIKAKFKAKIGILDRILNLF